MHKKVKLYRLLLKTKNKKKFEVPDTDFFNQQHTFLFDKLEDLIKIIFPFLAFCYDLLEKNIKFYNGLIYFFKYSTKINF